MSRALYSRYYRHQNFLKSVISNVVEENVICHSFIVYSFKLMIQIIKNLASHSFHDRNTTLSIGCPTVVSISPSPTTFEAGDELTCSADGYDPTYSWTGTAGVNGAAISEIGDTYELPRGPFILACTAIVEELGCSTTEFIINTAYGKY